MRLAIVNLTHGRLSGGYVKYLRAIVPRLAAHPEIERVHIFAPQQARGALQGAPWNTDTWFAPGRGFPGLKQEVLARAPDAILIPTARWIDFGRIPTVVMVRNMEPLEAPFGGNPLSESLRNLARRMAARRACQRAARVIAVSQHVAGFLTNRWAIPPARVGVVYHGVDSDQAPPPDRPGGLPDRLGAFVFTAGSIRPARGLRDLVDALGHLRASGPFISALIAGAVDPGMEPHLRQLQNRAAAAGIANRIVWLGPLSEAEMRWCYEATRAFVVTSRAEACPNVVLEAMSYGCASVSVDHAPMPEFFGPAAAYYRMGDTTSLARALTSLISAPEAHLAGTRAAASARVREFSWDRTADRTVAELKSALRARPR